MRLAAQLFILAVACPLSASSQQVTRLDSTAVTQWKEDLGFLETEATRRHGNLFHTMPRAAFDSALSSISSRLPTLARHEVIVELQKLAAMIGDGHSNVSPWRDSLIAFRSLPVSLYWFEEGMVVRAADSAHSRLIGGRVVEIGELPVDSAIALVRPLVSRDNEMAVRLFAAYFLAMPEILHATGISRTLESVRLVIEKNGRRETVSLKPAGKFPMLTGDIDKNWRARQGWVDARDSAPPALWLSDLESRYWFRYLPDTKALYTQISTIQHDPKDSLRTFMRRAIAAADSAGAERFIIDLRLNTGGDGGFNKQIILPMIKSRYDTTGRFFVITGRRTFSAAQMLVTELEKYSSAIFVGEPTSSKANHYGDSYRIVLPNSKVTFRVSMLWHQYRDSRDKRQMIPPAIPVGLTFADYAAGRDPVLEAALRH